MARSRTARHQRRRGRPGPLLLVIAAAALLAGCTRYETAYEEAVVDHEQVYCYRTLADVDCHRIPFPPDSEDARRLVNYYGPSPRLFYDD